MLMKWLLLFIVINHDGGVETTVIPQASKEVCVEQANKLRVASVRVSVAPICIQGETE